MNVCVYKVCVHRCVYLGGGGLDRQCCVHSVWGKGIILIA